MSTPKWDPGEPPESAPEPPKKEHIEFLLTLVVDADDRAVLQRIQEALSVNLPPTDDDLEVYQDLWDTFGEDLEGDV